MKDNPQLARSQNYRVAHEFEVVFLERLTWPGDPIVIGDFYGDPNAAIIDQDERFVIMVGHGLIIYHLREPFEPFHYRLETEQWKEMLRGTDSTWSIESIVQQSPNAFLFTVDPYSNHAGTYCMTWPNWIIEKEL